MFTPMQLDPSNYRDLDRELDRTKSSVFLDKYNPGFLGSLMCSLNFMWSKELPTAGTDGTVLVWNPDYFVRLPKPSRSTDLTHELWHVGLLHNLRRGSRNHEIWNIACDIRIDLLLEEAGFTFEGIQGVPRDPKYKGWAEEDIYDDLINNNPPTNMQCTCCASQMPDINPQTLVNSVVMAMHQAKQSGQAGNLPGVIKETLDKFLEPVIPWETVLMAFFTDMLQEDYSWKRPNRRYEDMYLPSKFTDDGRLEHLIYYLDVSGSITDSQALRFSSEVKFIQEVLKPQKLTLVQFDTKIQSSKEFKEEEPFDDIEIIGRGGTSLVCVREHILEHNPTAAVIFTDMEVAPMQKLDKDIPVVWAIMDNPHGTAPFGKVIHIHKDMK